MKIRIGGVIVVVIASLRLVGGCSSDSSQVNADAGSDGLAATLGTGGAIDAPADLPADLAVDHPSSGSGGAPGTGGAGAGGSGVGGAGAGGVLGAGGALGTGGTPGMGGSMSTGGAPGTGGTAGLGGSGAGGTAGTTDAGSDIAVDTGPSVDASGPGGAGGADAGAGGSSGAGGSQTDGSATTDAAADAPTATLNQIWSTILTVVTPADTAPGCIGCHDGRDSTIPNYTSTATTYATWVGVPAIYCSGIRVTAGNAETSVLVNLLRAKPNLGLGVTVCSGGAAMPFGPNQRITLDQLHMIENWINAGALND